MRVKALSGSLEERVPWWDERTLQGTCFPHDKPEQIQCPVCKNVIGDSVYGADYEQWYIAIKIKCPKCGIMLIMEDGVGGGE